jgi:hypothetical protein
VDLKIWQLVLKHFVIKHSSLLRMFGLNMQQELHSAKRARFISYSSAIKYSMKHHSTSDCCIKITIVQNQIYNWKWWCILLDLSNHVFCFHILCLAHENGAFSNPQPYLQMSNTNRNLTETLTQCLLKRIVFNNHEI